MGAAGSDLVGTKATAGPRPDHPLCPLGPQPRATILTLIRSVGLCVSPVWGCYNFSVTGSSAGRFWKDHPRGVFSPWKIDRLQNLREFFSHVCRDKVVGQHDKRDRSGALSRCCCFPNQCTWHVLQPRPPLLPVGRCQLLEALSASSRLPETPGGEAQAFPFLSLSFP